MQKKSSILGERSSPMTPPFSEKEKEGLKGEI